MQKYGMRREWRRERKEVEVNFTDSLYEDSCFYRLGKPLLFFKFKCGPTLLSSSPADTLFLLTTSQKREEFPGLRSPWWRFSNPVWRMHTPPKPWPSKRNQSIPSPLSFPYDVHQRIPLTAQITGCWTHLTKKDQWVNSGLNNSITLPVFRHPLIVDSIEGLEPKKNMIMFRYGTETRAYDCLLTCGYGKNGLHLIYRTQRVHNISKINNPIPKVQAKRRTFHKWTKLSELSWWKVRLLAQFFTWNELINN